MLRITMWFDTEVSHARKPWNMVEVLGDLWDRKQHEVSLWCLVFLGGRRTMRGTPGGEPVCTVRVTPGPGHPE